MKTILYAEDRDDDVFFFNRACSRAGLTGMVRLQAVENGALAIDYLAGAGRFADRSQFPLPDLAVLDLKMPGKSGFEVLAWIRSTPKLRELPVFLLTSSNQESDVQRGRALGANGHLVKSGDLDELTRMVRQLYAACLTPVQNSANADQNS